MSLTRREWIGTAIGSAALAAAPRPTPAQEAAPARGHVVLLGDSIFDNKRFVRDADAIDEQLSRELPAGWKVTRLAAINTTTQEVAGQIERIPAAATHLVLSAGGNDSILGLFNVVQGVNFASHMVLPRLQQDRAAFDRNYTALVAKLIARKLPVLVCTIPEPDFTHRNVRDYAIIGELGLPLFNDVITRVAARHRLPVLDLRVLIEGKGDHAPIDGIHLSPAGGRKVAEAIARIVREHDFARPRSGLYS